jgi:hypothetical protein
MRPFQKISLIDVVRRRRHKGLAPKHEFHKRVLRGFLASCILIAFSLLLGVAGYAYFGNLKLVDALLNASMILTGMGPVNPMTTVGGKLFASFYALYSGLAFLTIAATVFGPVFHRFMHKFHLELAEEEEEEPIHPQPQEKRPQ